MNGEHFHNLIIVGAGPAGLSAAIQARRMGLNPLVMERDQPGGQALAAYSIENYPGCPFGVSGRQLMNRFIEHARGLEIDIQACEVKSIRAQGTYYSVNTDSGTYTCRALIAACGLAPKRLNIKGVRELQNTRVFSYIEPARIDHKDKRILIIGGGDAAFDQALGFADRAESVTIAMRNATPRCLFLLSRRAERRNIRVLRSASPVAVSNEGESVRIMFSPTGSSGKNGAWKHDCDFVITCLGKTADLTIFKPLIEAAGPIPLEPGPVKKWPGLYLAGDLCRGNLRQISIAAGDGMKAAMEIHSYLIETSNDEHPFTHG